MANHQVLAVTDSVVQTQYLPELKGMARCRLRISLGLKPLSAENESDKQRQAQQEREAQKAEEEKAAKAAALAERVKACVPPHRLPPWGPASCDALCHSPDT